MRHAAGGGGHDIARPARAADSGWRRAYDPGGTGHAQRSARRRGLAGEVPDLGARRDRGGLPGADLTRVRGAAAAAAPAGAGGPTVWWRTVRWCAFPAHPWRDRWTPFRGADDPPGPRRPAALRH